MALTKVKAGNILLTTPSASSNDVTPATTAYVTTALANMVDSAPSTLNTLNELAAALGDDANFSTTVTNNIAAKLPLAGGTLTGNIAHASNFTLDIGGELIIDVDAQGSGNGILLKDDGNLYGSIFRSSSHLHIKSEAQDKNLLFMGNDGGSEITALTLSMQDAGKATFNAGGVFNDDVSVFGTDSKLYIGESGSGGTFGFLGWNDASNYLFLGNSYNSAFNTDLVISSTGNVGIGTASISSWAKLQVQGTAGLQTGATQALYVASPTASAHEGVGIRMSAASGSHEAVGIIGMVNNASGNAGSMTFHTYNLGATIPERMRIQNNGNVGIGTTGAVTKLHVEGPQNDVYGQLYIKGGSASSQDPQIAMGSSTNGRGFYLDDGDVNRFKIYTGHGKGATSGAYEFVLDNSGTIESKRTYNNTTGAYSANVYVHTDGSFNRATSSRRYKTDIVDATKGLDEILQLKPRNYKPENNRTDSPEPNAEVNDPHLDAAERTFAGLIAEEVHDLGLTEYVDYEEDGTTPSGLYYGNMIALLVKGIQEQQTIINDLKSRIETLEG